MATLSSILAWRIPWTEDLTHMHRETYTHTYTYTETYTHIYTQTCTHRDMHTHVISA